MKLNERLTDLRARLATVEAERDAARAGQARAVEALKRIVRCGILPEPEDLNHCDNCLCNFCENKDIHEQILAAISQPALAWLAQREREAAAKALEKAALKGWATPFSLREEAAALRDGKGVGDA